MKDKRNIIILALLLVMVVASYGFVSYSTRAVEERRSSQIKKWDVAITGVETIINGEADAKNYKFTEGTLTINPVMNSIEDEIEYRVTITNNGLLEAKLSDRVYTIKNPDSAVIFTYDNTNKIIKSKESVMVSIKAKVDKERYEEGIPLTNELVALFQYIQN